MQGAFDDQGSSLLCDITHQDCGNTLTAQTVLPSDMLHKAFRSGPSSCLTCPGKALLTQPAAASHHGYSASSTR